MTKRSDRYEIQCEDWWQLWDTGIPDAAYDTLGEGEWARSTVLHITDPEWAMRFRETKPEFLTRIMPKPKRKRVQA